MVKRNTFLWKKEKSYYKYMNLAQKESRKKNERVYEFSDREKVDTTGF